MLSGSAIAYFATATSPLERTVSNVSSLAEPLLGEGSVTGLGWAPGPGFIVVHPDVRWQANIVLSFA